MPWLLALPGIAALLAFHFVPVGAGTYYSFTKWNGLTQPVWVGLDNFRRIFSDPHARGALVNTLELTACFVVAVNAIGLGLALALNRAVRTRHFLRLLFFAPVALSSLAIAYVWGQILQPQGALNHLLADVGLGSLQRLWLADPRTALWAVLVVMIWQYSGLAMILYLAGLQGISDDVYEATLVDGASPWLRFRRVVLPLLAPATTVSVAVTLTHGLRVFDQIKALTDGGPVGATETLATDVYLQTFELGKFGYGAAYAVILTLLIVALALAQVAVSRMNEERL